MYPFIYGADEYGFESYETPVDGSVYNNILYNENLYNSAILFLALSDNITGSDSQEPYPQIAKVETIVLAEAILKLLNNDPWFDDIIPLDAIVTFLTSKQLTGEFMTVSDFCQLVPNKLSTETLTLIENLVINFNTAYYDSLFLNDTLIKQVTNKGMFDAIRLADWLTLTPIRQDNWSD